MVTDEKINNSALLQYRLGNLSILLGILIWLPFIVLRVAGEKPSLFWFLPFHLLGVIGGSRLRKYARKEMGILPAKQSPLKKIGHGLIFAGILVWLPYFYLKMTVEQPVEVMNFLPFHLTGVLGGVVLLLIDYFNSRKAQL